MSAQMDAIDLLNLGDEGRNKPDINKIWAPLLGTIFGVSSGVSINFGTRRPLFSGIQKHILGVAVFVPLLMFIDKKRDEYFNERDATLRYYVKCHPEDFPRPERKKIGDIIEPWNPIR